MLRKLTRVLAPLLIMGLGGCGGSSPTAATTTTTTSSPSPGLATVTSVFVPDPATASPSSNPNFTWQVSFVLTFTETAGVGETITSLSYVLQQAAGGIIIIPPSGQAEIYQGVVDTPTTGGPRVEGNGTNSIPFHFFYTLPDGGRGAVITITPNFRDDNGNVSSQTLTLRVL